MRRCTLPEKPKINYNNDNKVCKIAKYSKLASTHMFYPIAIETAGTWDDMAIELVQEIGRRTTVDRFTYLGSILACDGDAEADDNCRIGKAASVFQRMRSIWSLSVISTDTKIWLYKAKL